MGTGWPDDEPDVVPDDDLFGNPGDLTWKGAGFNPDEVDAWIDSFIVDPAMALEIRRVAPNVTHDDLRLPSPVQGDPEYMYRIGEHVRDGTIPVADLDQVVARERHEHRMRMRLAEMPT